MNFVIPVLRDCRSAAYPARLNELNPCAVFINNKRRMATYKV